MDDLLVLAQKVPDDIKQRMIERPDAFSKFASLDDSTMDELLKQIEEREQKE